MVRPYSFVCWWEPKNRIRGYTQDDPSSAGEPVYGGNHLEVRWGRPASPLPSAPCNAPPPLPDTNTHMLLRHWDILMLEAWHVNNTLLRRTQKQLRSQFPVESSQKTWKPNQGLRPSRKLFSPLDPVASCRGKKSKPQNYHSSFSGGFKSRI